MIIRFGMSGFGWIKGRTNGQPAGHTLLPPMVGGEDLSQGYQGGHSMFVVFPNDFAIPRDMDFRHLCTRILAEQF